MADIYNVLYVGAHHLFRFSVTSCSGLICTKVELSVERCSVPFTANNGQTVWHKRVQIVVTISLSLLL